MVKYFNLHLICNTLIMRLNLRQIHVCSILCGVEKIKIHTLGVFASPWLFLCLCLCLCLWLGGSC